jgi:xylulokinase
MPSDNVMLGVDVGTQSTKVLVYDVEEKEILQIASAPHDIIQKPDGTSEQKASWWTAAMDQCFTAISPDIRRAVKCIGVSGQQHGFVPVDAAGEVIYNVKLWNDTSTEAECEEITRAFGGAEKLIETVGNPILPGYTAPKVRWLKNHHPDVYQKLAYVLLPHDYINFYLTGAYAMEYGDASGTGVLSIRTRTWSKEMLKAMDPERDLGQCLPPLVSPDHPSGTLSADIAEKYGFAAGIPVSAGGGDNMMAAIGTGCVAEGVFTASLGTSGTLFGYSNQPVIDPQGAFAAFCSSTGGWLPLVCTMNCTVASELTRHLFDMPVKEFDALAATAPAGSDGLVTVPFYSGERTPNLPSATGTILGMTPQNMTKPHLFRSALESALFGLKFGLGAFRKQGLNPTKIHLTGGGAKSPIWRQMAADIFDCPIALPEVEEAAAFGAALQALWMKQARTGSPESMESISKTHGMMNEDVVIPEPKSVDAYMAAYGKYMDSLNLLIPHFSQNQSRR